MGDMEARRECAPRARHGRHEPHRGHPVRWVILCALVLLANILGSYAAAPPSGDSTDDVNGADVLQEVSALDKQLAHAEPMGMDMAHLGQEMASGAAAEPGPVELSGQDSEPIAADATTPGTPPDGPATGQTLGAMEEMGDVKPQVIVGPPTPAATVSSTSANAGAQAATPSPVEQPQPHKQQQQSQIPPLADTDTDTAFSVSVLDYGAVKDGSKLCTDAFNAAIRELSARGGGVLRVPAGKYLVTTIRMASGVTLDVEGGATILASTEAADWKPVSYTLSRPQCYGTMGDTKFERRFFGGPVLYCVDCDNIAVQGEGIIDGQGSKWWRNPEDPRGYLAFFVNSTNIHISGLTFQNSAAWNIVPKFCTNVTVDDVKVYNHYVQGHNTDGVNPYGSKNVSITNTVIVTGDDCIAVKSGPRPSCGIPSEDIVVYNVTCVGSHGLTIGSEMNAGVRNVHFANITIDGRNTPSSQGVRLKSQRGRGGFVENILYENIRIHNVKIGIQATLNYREVDASLRPIPYFRNITIRNVYGTMIRRTFGSIDGLPDAPIEGIHLDNIYMFGDSKTTPLVCKDATDATFGLVFPPPRVTGSCATRWPVFLTDLMGLNWSGLPRWFSMHLLNWFW